jgi:dTDP-4-amino-4,6-dideoxygalactose transaminase
MKFRIPFNRVSPVGKEMQYIADAIAGSHLAGDGIFSRRVVDLLERTLPSPKVLLTTSASSALEMSAILLGIGPEDEVIVPSFAFPTVAGAFALRGARIVFADVRPDTFNLDESKIESLITKRTRAIVLIHYSGVACEMDRISELAKRWDIAIIEDCAHGPFASYKKRPIGTFGSMAVLSFHETKNFTCGEGGALLVNDPDLIERAEIVHQKGTDRNRFFRGEVDKYSWIDFGSSYVLSELNAAFLFAQLEEKSSIQARRSRIWHRYNEGLADWAARHGVLQPRIPINCEQAFHLYYLVVPMPEARSSLIDHLRERKIYAAFHYVPLHQSAMGRRIGEVAHCMTGSEFAGECLVRLPFFTTLEVSMQDAVIQAVTEFEPQGQC